MNEEKRRLLDIIDDEVELKKEENRKKQEKIKKLIKETIEIGEAKNEHHHDKL